MRRRRLFWLVFASYVAITFGLLGLVLLDAGATLRKFYQASVRSSLEAHARWFAQLVRQPLSDGRYDQIDALAKRLGPAGGIRITVILPDGKVVAESERPPQSMDDHRTRPEIAAALQDRHVRWQVRLSPTLREELLYVALPVPPNGQPVAVVRTAQSTAAIQEALKGLTRRVLGGAALALLFILAASWLMARGISRPVEIMTAGAERFGRGELDYRLPVVGSRELARLAEAMNAMASQLRDQIQTIVRQRHEQDAVLLSMAEGVLTVDNQGRVLDLNDAGAKMLQLDPAKARGRFVHEVLRRPALLDFVDKALSSPLPIQEDLVIYDDQPRCFTASGNLLRNARNERIGVLVVLRDVTRLRQLENLRRDFVANASHELRTPVTSIKGFVETLLEQGIEDRQNAQRFLQIILQEANRLSALIDDILSLARIEKETEEKRIVLEPGLLKDVIDAALARCQPLAGQRHMQLAATCPADLEARIHRGLLEQALVNLLDNAIKYSEPGKTVRLEVRQVPGQTVIAVIDQGFGIEPRHLPRLFERFYRVDAGRSRQTGGTGLGLAIVKHIALAHGGWVSVESTLGAGSTFAIHLPAYPVEDSFRPSAPREGG